MFREAYLDIMRFIEMGGDVLWFKGHEAMIAKLVDTVVDALGVGW